MTQALVRLAGAFGLALLLLLILAGVASSTPRPPAAVQSSALVTPVWLGNPIVSEMYSVPYSAQHIWDLQVWQGRVYLGYGDWDKNLGPPVYIWYYTPTASIFVSETVYVSETRPAAPVDEEAIDRYVVIDGDLYIPGTDPKDLWDLGNFYRNEEVTGWVKHRTIPLGIHAFDMAGYGGDLFVAIGPDGGAALMRSEDGGLTWTPAISDVEPSHYYHRFYELYELKGTLFAVKSPTATYTRPSVYSYCQHSGFVTTAIDLVPDQSGGLIFVRDEVFVFGNSILYIPWFRDTITSSVRPISALYKAHIWQNGQRVAFFDGKYPRDVVVAGRWVYVLDAGGLRCIVGEGSPDQDGYTATIYVSSDLTAWLPVAAAHFTDTPSALEVLDGVAYVGTYSGDVYALPLSHYSFYFPLISRE